MSSAKIGESPFLVSPVAKGPATATTPSEAALHPPGLVSRLRASRPSGAWLIIGMLSVLLAFAGGLLAGRSLAPAKSSARGTDAEAEKPE
jgi:hypothetical protein